MLFVDNGNNTDPRLNLALEEYLLREVGTREPLLLLYVNEPSVIIGRNQNVFEEIDPSFFKNGDIHLVRRLSGGGTVYHDLGNLNYSFITEGQRNLHKFELVLAPVIHSLREIGVEADFRPRSDIVIRGKKISGNAQYASRGRMFSHGTLLFDTDLDLLQRAIRPGQAEIASKAVQSVRSSVCNIGEVLPQEWTIEDLKRAIVTGIFGPGETPLLPLTDEDWVRIREIAADRYMSWAWNIGRSPRFTLAKSGTYSGGVLTFQMEVEKGLIKEIEFTGEMAADLDNQLLEGVLVGVRYDPHDLLAALDSLGEEIVPDSLTKEALVDLLY